VLTASGDTLYYLHSDHLGSTSLASCGNAACGALGSEVPSSRQSYYPFGEIRMQGTNLPTDVGFTGQRFDSHIKLIQMGARWYDPQIGRWISPDTIVPDPKNPQQLNRLTYGLNNPVKHSDPTGHFSEDEIQRFFRKESWEDVLKLFQDGGELEGRWGWLAILQKAEFGDDIKIEWDTPPLPEGHPKVKEVFAGRCEESPGGDLWIVGGDSFIDQMKAAKYGRAYELTHYHPMNVGKVAAGVFLITVVDFGIGIPAVYVTAQSAGNPLVIKAVEALEVAVVLPANALGLKLIIDGLGHAPEKFTVPAHLDPWANLPRLKP